jgi:hypothetical protein
MTDMELAISRGIEIWARNYTRGLFSTSDLMTDIMFEVNKIKPVWKNPEECWKQIRGDLEFAMSLEDMFAAGFVAAREMKEVK